MDTLPTPVTHADKYLHDIAISLRCIHDRLAAAFPPVEGVAEEEELKEPAPKAKHRDAKKASG